MDYGNHSKAASHLVGREGKTALGPRPSFFSDGGVSQGIKVCFRIPTPEPICSQLFKFASFVETDFRDYQLDCPKNARGGILTLIYRQIILGIISDILFNYDCDHANLFRVSN